MKHWIDCIWSTEYIIYEALNILYIEYWVDNIWSIEYTTYKALNILHIALRRKQWDWFYNSFSYFALFEDLPLILMRLSTNSKKRHRFCIQR